MDENGTQTTYTVSDLPDPIMANETPDVFEPINFNYDEEHDGNC